MRHFLFEDKAYRINPAFRRRRNEQDSARALARLLRKVTPRTRHSSGGGVFRGIDARQKCVVKMQYSFSGAAHKLQIEQYLVREGAGVDGDAATLYGTDIEEYRAHMTAKNFRIFLSPQSDNINLTDMTRDFVQKLEQQTGYQLRWQGANHYNTAHPHAHLLINGVDKNENEIDFPRDVVKTFMREYARDICTAQTGRRTREEIALEKERELTAPRYTRLDETIKGFCYDGSGRVNLAGYVKDRERILARLESLRKLNLCSYADRGYRLSPGWEENLRANGRYNVFLRARTALRYSNLAGMRVYSGEQGDITGKVTKVYRTDGDASDNHAVILEALDGKAYFVPLMNEPGVWYKHQKTKLNEGELVTIKTVKNQRGRLTPVIFKQEPAQIRKEITKNKYESRLAEEMKQIKTGLRFGKRTRG